MFKFRYLLKKNTAFIAMLSFSACMLWSQFAISKVITKYDEKISGQQGYYPAGFCSHNGKQSTVFLRSRNIHVQVTLDFCAMQFPVKDGKYAMQHVLIARVYSNDPLGGLVAKNQSFRLSERQDDDFELIKFDDIAVSESNGVTITSHYFSFPEEFAPRYAATKGEMLVFSIALGDSLFSIGVDKDEAEEMKLISSLDAMQFAGQK